MARIVNPYNLDDDDDAVFSALLSQGLIWIEDDEDDEDGFENCLESKIEYLESSGQTKVHVLQGHGKHINAIEVQGDNVFSASADRTIRVWNWNTGEEIQILKGHRGSVKSLAVSGDFVISASDDKTVRIWNWITGVHVRTLDGYLHEVSRVAGDGNIVACASHNEIWIRNWQTGELLQKLTDAHSSVVSSIIVDGDLVLSVSSDLVVVHNWTSGQVLHTLGTEIGSTIYENRIGLDRKFFVYVGFDDIYVWNWKTGDHLSTFDLLQAENRHITTKVFFIYSNICVFSRKICKWYFYRIDAAFDKAALVDGYRNIITTDHGGWVYVVRPNPSLGRVVGLQGKSTSATPKSAITRGSEKHRQNQPVEQSHATDDVLLAARDFIHKRNEEWVNFSRVSQHLHERFSKLKPKQLGRPSKHYGSLLKVFADFPCEFELRRDAEKQGLYWIRLKPTP